MQSCSPLISSGTCDTYDHNDDMTEHRQDWVEGSYVFDLISTSSIELELTWAVREFERDTSGSGPVPRLATPSSKRTVWTPTMGRPPT